MKTFPHPDSEVVELLRDLADALPDGDLKERATEMVFHLEDRSRFGTVGVLRVTGLDMNATIVPAITDRMDVQAKGAHGHAGLWAGDVSVAFDAPLAAPYVPGFGDHLVMMLRRATEAEEALIGKEE